MLFNNFLYTELKENRHFLMIGTRGCHMSTIENTFSFSPKKAKPVF